GRGGGTGWRPSSVPPCRSRWMPPSSTGASGRRGPCPTSCPPSRASFARLLAADPSLGSTGSTTGLPRLASAPRERAADRGGTINAPSSHEYRHRRLPRRRPRRRLLDVAPRHVGIHVDVAGGHPA